MSMLFKNMNIGPKFVLSIGGVAFAIIAVGLVLIYQQSRRSLNCYLSNVANFSRLKSKSHVRTLHKIM